METRTFDRKNSLISAAAHISRQVVRRSPTTSLTGLPHPAEHFYQGIDGEFGVFLIHHIRNPRAGYPQNLSGFGLL
jgi:hypothetical protein